MGISEFQLQQMLARMNRAKDPEVQPCVERERGLHDEIIFACKQRGWLTIHSRMDMPSTVAVGCPDFVILADGGRTLLVEAKSRTGKLRPEQRAWLAWAEKLGHRAAVVRSIKEFLDFADSGRAD